MKITLFSRDKCISIAEKNYPSIKSEDELLDYLPDSVFGQSFDVENTEEICNKTIYTIRVDRTPCDVSEEFVRCIEDVIMQSDYSRVIEPNELVFSNNIGWLIKIDNHGIVTVNPEIKNQQPDEIAKQVLDCIDKSILTNFMK